MRRDEEDAAARISHCSKDLSASFGRIELEYLWLVSRKTVLSAMGIAREGPARRLEVDKWWRECITGP